MHVGNFINPNNPKLLVVGIAKWKMSVQRDVFERLRKGKKTKIR